MEKNQRRRGQENKKDNKKKKSKKRFIKYGVLAAVVIIIISAVLLFVNQLVVPTVAANNPLSILIVGTDVDSHRDESFDGTKPEKTDALMVVTFNPDTYKVVATSIPRDTAVDYICPETGEMRGKINEVYPASENNMDCLVDTVSNFLNIPIDYYIKFNLDQAAAIIDQVGGITITAHAADGVICQESTDGENSYCWYDGETYEMDGTEAICYARARHDSEKDYGRGIRQQQVAKATFEAIALTGFDIELIKSLFAMVETNMEPKLLYDYYNYALAINSVLGMYSGTIPVDSEAVPNSVWEALFTAANYDEKDINNETISAYFDFVKTNGVELSDYFIDNYQFVNDTVDGYYVTVDEQRYEISNALRTNLGLKEEEPPAYMYPFGTNTFNQSSGGGDSTSDAPAPVEEEPAPVEEEPAPTDDTQGVVDTDGDGYDDTIDMCIDTAPITDDGTGCEAVVEEIDTDGDGYFNTNDSCPDVASDINTDDINNPGCPVETVVDTDGDKYPDDVDMCTDVAPINDDGYGCEAVVEDPDTDADGYPDSVDACPSEPANPDIADAANPGCPVEDSVSQDSPTSNQ